MKVWICFLLVFEAICPRNCLAAASPQSLVWLPEEVIQASVQKEYGRRWRVAESDHFKVYSDSSLRYHKLVTGLLEQFYGQVHDLFFNVPMSKLDVYLVDGGSDFEKFVHARGLGGYAGSFGVYVAEKRAIFTRRRFKDGGLSGIGTLFHETIHAFVHAQVGRRDVPAWFNESFASLFEQGRVIEGRWIYGNPNPWREKLFRPRFETGRMPALRSFLRSTDRQFYESNDENINYNTGRSLFLYVLLRLGEPVLRKLVQDLLAGTEGIDALQNATRMPLERIEAAWKDNIRRVNFGGDYLARANGFRSIAVMEEGLKFHPDYGMLRLELADAYLEEGKYSEALEQAERALKDPRLLAPQRAYRIIALACKNTDPQRALTSIQRVVELQPWVENLDTASFEQLAQGLEASKKVPEAAAIRQQLAEQVKEDALGHE